MKIRKWKKRVETPEQIIEKAQNKVNEAFGMFQQAHDAIEEANFKHELAKEEAVKETESLKSQLANKERTVQKADDEIAANKKLQERLKDFLV